MRIMAIDYGDDHTGIAISDHTGFMAGTTTIINANRPEQLAEEYAVKELVLGYPKNMAGRPSGRRQSGCAPCWTIRSGGGRTQDV